MVKLLLIIVIVFFNAMFSNTSAANEIEEQKTLSLVSEFTLRDEVISLVELSQNSPSEAQSLVINFSADMTRFNYAEQYLILLAKAKVKQHEQQHEAAISIIKKAKLLTKHIEEKQLKLPLFSDVYLVLSISYEALKDYNNAYINKKSFVDNFNDYTDTKRENTVEKLTEKYEVANKNQENELLANQNKLKALHLSAVKQEQNYLQKKILIIFSSILLFVLLFLRQFKVRKKLLLLSEIDSLTGLLNRSALFKWGHKLVKKANEEQGELSVLIFDIDFFKQFNEDFGHLLGDDLLKKVAQLVSETMRSRDVFARLGGEEFVAILPSSDLSHAKAIAVRVLEKVAQYDFTELAVNRNITLSLGVASLKDDLTEFDDILHAADLAMYQAKAQGRNQIVSYESIVKDQERRQR